MRAGLMLLVAVLVATLMAGCIQPITVEEAQQDVVAAESALCFSIETYQASVVALEGITAETTVAEVEDLKQAEAAAYDAMVEAWGDLQSAEVQAVESAVAEFHDAFQGVEGTDTLGDIAANIQSSAATVKAAVDQLDQTACAPTQ